MVLVATSSLVSGCGEGLFQTTPPPYPALDPAEFADADGTGARPMPAEDLPATALAVLSLVEAGGPFPDPRDGRAFIDANDALPTQAAGYYRQYAVVEPGVDGPTSWYLVIGDGGEVYWSTDDRASFRLVEP